MGNMNSEFNNNHFGEDSPMEGKYKPFDGKTQFYPRYPDERGVVPVNCEESMHVTTLDELRMYGQGQVVRFPDFAEGQPFVAKVRRPSMLTLAKSGRIPNTLMHTASKLFAKGGAGLDTDDEKMLCEFYDTCRIICEAALISPTMEDFENAGICLSDEQMMAIFNYTQTGVKSLENFRKK